MTKNKPPNQQNWDSAQIKTVLWCWLSQDSTQPTWGQKNLYRSTYVSSFQPTRYYGLTYQLEQTPPTKKLFHWYTNAQEMLLLLNPVIPRLISYHKVICCPMIFQNKISSLLSAEVKIVSLALVLLSTWALLLLSPNSKQKREVFNLPCYEIQTFNFKCNAKPPKSAQIKKDWEFL